MRDIWINGANGRWRIVLGADLALRLGTPGDGTRKFANCYRFMKEIIANGLLSVLTEHTLLVDMAKTGKQYYQQPWRYGKAATYAMINGLEPEDFKENAMFENSYNAHREWVGLLTKLVTSQLDIEGDDLVARIRHFQVTTGTCVGNYFQTLQKLKESLEGEGKPKRPIQDGPTGFAAPACAALLEKDGRRRWICTRVAATFRQLGEILKEWSANKIWVLVWPMEKGFKDKDISEILKACERHFEDGGRIITAWPPVVESNVETWKKMAEIWSRMDQAIERRSGCGQLL
ncbi:unnamed protein product [Heligmosomoides polygyrus]|uniref:Macro domain-containing protein n=1 Tax=Heligmosomoides polygyrus TaxID=6339 RepID=A0A183G9K4_HELPZ|nr:unnamed protein product [Heligmosomoides polygyrus]